MLAGSETQVMSLWAVDDASTRDLMVGFYAWLNRGEGRAAALRNVQLAMLRGTPLDQDQGGRNRGHPFFWAAFIVSGAWTSMSAPAR
jgi:CHAT domain-containing protein